MRSKFLEFTVTIKSLLYLEDLANRHRTQLTLQTVPSLPLTEPSVANSRRDRYIEFLEESFIE